MAESSKRGKGEATGSDADLGVRIAETLNVLAGPAYASGPAKKVNTGDQQELRQRLTAAKTRLETATDLAEAAIKEFLAAAKEADEALAAAGANRTVESEVEELEDTTFDAAAMTGWVIDNLNEQYPDEIVT